MSNRAAIVKRMSGTGPRILGAVAVVTVTLSGCSVTPERPAADQSLRVVVEETPKGIDICDEQLSPTGVLLTGNVAESLTKLDFDTGDIKPLLALDWSNPTPDTWRFNLRKNVKFHDGQPFDANAVAQWIARIVNPKAGCYALNSAISPNVLGATAVDADTVDIKTKEPDPILSRRLAFVGIGAPMKDPLTKSNQPIGTGPYKFVSWSPGQDFKVSRFDGYWGKKPDISSVDYAFRSESSVRAAMASAGEVDVAANIAAQDAKTPGAVNYTVAETLYFRLDVYLPPLNDIRVRRAIGYAIDRKTLIDTVYGGYGRPANDIVLPSVIGYDPQVQWSYDPDKAKQLLAEAAATGVPVDKTIEIVGPANQRGSNGSEIEDTIAAMLNAVGLKTKVVIKDDVPRLNNPRDPSYQPALVQNVHGNSTGDAFQSLSGKLGCGAAQSPICDKTLDAMLTAAGQASGSDRVAKLQAADKYVFDNVVALIPVAHLNSTMIITNKNLEYTPNYATSEELVIADMHLK